MGWRRTKWTVQGRPGEMAERGRAQFRPRWAAWRGSEAWKGDENPTLDDAVTPLATSPATGRSAELWNRPFLRIGHGGAAGSAPANTLYFLSLALEMGMDMVGFDVRLCRDDLVLLHDDSLWPFGIRHRLASDSTVEDLRQIEIGPGIAIATLAEALAVLRGRALVNIDLKATGYEEAVVDLVRSRGMAGDVIYSSHYPASLRRIRRLEPSALTGLSVPEDRAHASGKRYLQPGVKIVLAWMRFTLPHRVLSMMATAQAGAVMLYHGVVSRRTVKTVQGAGGKVFVWTVDEADRIRALQAMGVNGVTSNHPQLFSEPAGPSARDMIKIITGT